MSNQMTASHHAGVSYMAHMKVVKAIGLKYDLSKTELEWFIFFCGYADSIDGFIRLSPLRGLRLVTEYTRLYRSCKLLVSRGYMERVRAPVHLKIGGLYIVTYKGKQAMKDYQDEYDKHVLKFSSTGKF